MKSDDFSGSSLAVENSALAVSVFDTRTGDPSDELVGYPTKVMTGQRIMTKFPTKVLRRVRSMGGRLSLFIDARGLDGRDIRNVATAPALDIKEWNPIRDSHGELAVLECVVGSWGAPQTGDQIVLMFESE